MNLNDILVALKNERDRIDRAISALDGIGSTGDVTSRRRTGRRGGRRHMSAAGRKRLSEMMKKHWAEGRGPRGRTKAMKTTRHMSAAARARIAAAQRARWAKLKRQQKKAA